jgi:hypothetical protein
VAGSLGEGFEVAFLAVAGLVVGADAAVDGDWSQLNPLRFRLVRSQQMRAWGTRSLVRLAAVSGVRSSTRSSE